MAPKKKPQYYTVQFEKFLEIVSENEVSSVILGDRIKDLINQVDNWENSPILDFLESMILMSSFKDFLDQKINNPSDEEIEFIKKNNIKDVLFSKEELEVLQSFFLAIEGRKQFLADVYTFSCSLN
jgi:hypothetical protein